MKKSFLLLPLAALALAGCTSTSSETESSTSTPEWQTDVVQSTEMPSSMTQPTFQPTTYPAPQAAAGSYGSTASSGSTEIVGSCQVVRDYNNIPVYSQIQKGCYTGSTYTVGKYDTLYLIGYLTGSNAQSIANLNGISATATLKPGQVLRVR